ncbi:dodecin family protein [Paraburkholderia sp. BL6669N2]|uniref:dodecin family protein n=1 Tax=Paraburkholderia sp. BL6669N2 TaxID=1938807 RepID=UPI00286847C0|nr:dodecin family protein [Paraburkholderia sp. BL6669N2]
MHHQIRPVTEIIGTSPTFWEDTAKNAVEIAANSLRDLRVAEVCKLDMRVDSGKVVKYRAREYLCLSSTKHETATPRHGREEASDTASLRHRACTPVADGTTPRMLTLAFMLRWSRCTTRLRHVALARLRGGGFSPSCPSCRCELAGRARLQRT